MPAYHSHFNDKDLLQSAGIRIIGGVPLLPFEARHSQGPAPRASDQFAKNGADIIGEVLKYFKSNVFFQNYEVLGDADRLLVYLTLYTHQCILRIARATSQDGVKREMFQLAIEPFSLPSDKGFMLHAFFKPTTSKSDADQLKAYLLQCRQEIGGRLSEIVCDGNGKPSKWWTCFAKRKFLGHALEGPGSK